MSPQLHDFTRTPRLPPDVKTRLVPWLQRANAVFAESLLKIGLSVQTRPFDHDTGWPLEVLNEWTGKPVSFRAFTSGSPTIIAFPNPMAQQLVAALVGDIRRRGKSRMRTTPVENGPFELVV